MHNNYFYALPVELQEIIYEKEHKIKSRNILRDIKHQYLKRVLAKKIKLKEEYEKELAELSILIAKLELEEAEGEEDSEEDSDEDSDED